MDISKQNKILPVQMYIDSQKPKSFAEPIQTERYNIEGRPYLTVFSKSKYQTVPLHTECGVEGLCLHSGQFSYALLEQKPHPLILVYAIYPSTSNKKINESKVEKLLRGRCISMKQFKSIETYASTELTEVVLNSHSFRLGFNFGSNNACVWMHIPNFNNLLKLDINPISNESDPKIATSTPTDCSIKYLDSATKLAENLANV